jgi:hypothetical protein
VGSLIKKYSGLMSHFATSPKTSNPHWNNLRVYMKILKKSN